MNAIETIGAFIISAAGIGGATAFGLFKVFGERWLNAKFEQRLVEHKHAQQKEIEQLRFKINALMDRATKLHQHEFEVLPEAWSRLNDAYGRTTAFISALQQYPDLNRMTSQHLEEFLSKSPLQKWEQAELRAESDKTKYYMKRIFWHRLSDAQAACREYHVYLRKSGIFIVAEMRDTFDKLDALIWDALVEHEINEGVQQIPRMRDKFKALNEQGPELLKRLENEVQDRLWNSQSVEL